MSLSQIAQFAGVSTSTVSRVINECPHVAPTTVERVRRCIRELNFTPPTRRCRGRAGVRPTFKTRVALLVFKSGHTPSPPAFEHLMRGASVAATEHNLHLTIHFVSPTEPLPPGLLSPPPSGLLLHGEQPGDAVIKRISGIPAVWLMSNRESSACGDQVMPDNYLIGELAARHLLSLGHESLAILTARSGMWAVVERALAFAAACREAGARVQTLQGSAADASDSEQVAPNFSSVRSLVQQLSALLPRPTGLFVAEDRLLPILGTELSRARIQTGLDHDFEVVSCNSDGAYLGGPSPMPATIDIRADLIGHRGVDHLVWRMRSRGPAERVRLLVEPRLVEPMWVLPPHRQAVREELYAVHA